MFVADLGRSITQEAGRDKRRGGFASATGGAYLRRVKRMGNT